MKKRNGKDSLREKTIGFSMPLEYNPTLIETKWQEKWKDNKTFSPDLDRAKKPYYNLMMFPYPSAEGMHVGNMYAFTGADIRARFKRMQGYDVFEPIGLDGFGIHSENFALKVGKHPMDQAKTSEKNFYRQLYAIGNSFDWTRTVETYDPSYYKWTQWIFIQMFKNGLAYRKKSLVNYCPSCKTVLADEQVIKGLCERCSSVVEKKELEQWFFKITHYAEKLLSNIEKLDWTEKVKIAQRNWIGKSEGALLQFPIVNTESILEVFTTRPDTLFGATFIVISPEHPFVTSLLNLKLTTQNSNLEDIKNYVKKAKEKPKNESLEENKDKTGVFSGMYAINPATWEHIPIWIAEYVLMDYGTGAIMAVPAHDERDLVFARKYKLSIRPVITKDYSHARSYLMGAQEITDHELIHLNIKIVEKKKNGDRVLDIPLEVLTKYEEMIEKKLTPGFWNEYIAPHSIVFIFKHVDSSVTRLILDRTTEEEIDTLAKQFSGVDHEEKNNVLGWLSKNSAYKDLLLHTNPGRIVNSGDLDDYFTPEAMPRILSWIEEKKIGVRRTHYHLRDWLISRQRYWGPPIPMIFCQSCFERHESWFTSEAGKTHLRIKISQPKADQPRVEKLKKENEDSNSQISNYNIMAGWYPDDNLPITLPRIDDYKPIGLDTKGNSDFSKGPLARHPEFYEVSCPSCGASAKRETDVSDTFLDSSWYFLRYISTENNTQAFDESRSKKWLPVSIYIGGAEHSVLHLLYARFVTLFLSNLKMIDFEEPFSKFFAHGLLIKEGVKMSKSKGNVIVPDDYIKKYGVDTLRSYLMFLGPFSQGGDFYDTGIEGMHRFLKRVWKLFSQSLNSSKLIDVNRLSVMHRTIKKVTNDIENFHYNTALASLMEWINSLSKEKDIYKVEAENFIKLLAPFAPHLTEELYSSWHNKTHDDSIHLSSWPSFSEEFLSSDILTIAIQINGKLRGSIKIESFDVSHKEKIEMIAKANINASKYLKGTIKKVVYIEGRVINFVL